MATFLCNMGVYYFEMYDILLVSVMSICPVSLVIFKIFEKRFSMFIIRAYHYSTDCFLLKFNYSIALISPGCYTII